MLITQSFGLPEKRGELQHCPWSCSLTSTETVCTVKHGSPGEINPITSCTHLSRPTHSPSCLLTFSFLSLFLLLLSVYPSSISTQHLSLRQHMALLNFRGYKWDQKIVWHNIFWTLNRASADPTPAKFKLFSSSWGIPCQGATANSVSSSEVSLQISFYCRRKRREQTPALWMQSFLSLSLLTTSCVNLFFFSGEKKRSTTVQNIQEIVCEHFCVADDLKCLSFVLITNAHRLC